MQLSEVVMFSVDISAFSGFDNPFNGLVILSQAPAENVKLLLKHAHPVKSMLFERNNKFSTLK